MTASSSTSPGPPPVDRLDRLAQLPTISSEGHPHDQRLARKTRTRSSARVPGTMRAGVEVRAGVHATRQHVRHELGDAVRTSPSPEM